MGRDRAGCPRRALVARVMCWDDRKAGAPPNAPSAGTPPGPIGDRSGYSQSVKARGASQGLRVAAEPGHEHQDLVDALEREGPGWGGGLGQLVGDDAAERFAFDGSAWPRVLGQHQAVADEVGAVVAEVAGVAVDEGEQVDGGAGAAGGGEEPLEALEAVAPVGGALEALLAGGLGHGGDDAGEGLEGAALEEGLGEVDARAVVAFRDEAGAGAEAGADLVADAGGGAGGVEEVLLRGEDHRDLVAAVAEAEEVVEGAERVERAAQGGEGTVGAAVVGVDGAAGVELRGGAAAHLDEHAAAGAVHRDVERRAVLRGWRAPRRGGRRTRWARSPSGCRRPRGGCAPALSGCSARKYVSRRVRSRRALPTYSTRPVADIMR